MMMWESGDRIGNILHSAASSGRREAFESVLGSLEVELTRDQVSGHSGSSIMQPRNTFWFPLLKMLVSV